MSGWLKAVFESLQKRVEPFLSGLFEVLGRIKWFVVSIVVAVVNLVVYAVSFFVWATDFFATTTGRLLARWTSVSSSAGDGWSSLSKGAALMNCIVPLDYLLSAGGVLFGTWILIQVWRGIVFLYRLIPAKFT